MMNAPFQGFDSFEARTENGRRPEAQAAGALRPSSRPPSGGRGFSSKVVVP